MTSLMQQLKARGATSERTEIDVSELFGESDGAEKVYVRQTTLGDREWMMKAMRSVGEGESVSLIPTMEARCRQIVRSLVDANGKRLMTDLDVAALMKECRSVDVDMIGKRIDLVAGVSPTIEDAEGN